MKFTLNQISLITGLNTRTLRNYIHDGFLQGDKSSGKWLFTPQQYNVFINHPSVQPAIKTKKLNYLFESIQHEPENKNWMTVVLNIGNHSEEAKALFFRNFKDCDYPDEGMLFETDKMSNGALHVVIAGPEDFVFDFLNRYKEAKKGWEEKNLG